MNNRENRIVIIDGDLEITFCPHSNNSDYTIIGVYGDFMTHGGANYNRSAKDVLARLRERKAGLVGNNQCLTLDWRLLMPRHMRTW
jgi:hypothetical protein